MPTLPQDPSLHPPLHAAIHLASSLGHHPDRCEILQNGHTLVARLSPSLVARIVNDPSGPRQGTTWFQREIAVASHLAHHHAPVIPTHPVIPPGPFFHQSYPINFWQFVTHVDEPAPLSSMASALHLCLDTLRSFPQELPHLAILHESLQLFRQPSQLHLLTPNDQTLLIDHLEKAINQLSRLPHQPLHGDAHPGNAINTTHGLLWTDWEDTFSGPVEWDLASLIWNEELLAHHHPAVHAALRAFHQAGGRFNPQTLQTCLVARAAVMCAWYPILYPKPSPQRQEKLHQRLLWLRSPQQDAPGHFTV